MSYKSSTIGFAATRMLKPKDRALESSYGSGMLKRQDRQTQQSSTCFKNSTRLLAVERK